VLVAVRDGVRQGPRRPLRPRRCGGRPLRRRLLPGGGSPHGSNLRMYLPYRCTTHTRQCRTARAEVGWRRV